MSSIKDALLRSALIGVTPSTRDELYLVADALRIWDEHPELRNELVDKTGVTAKRMMTRCAMVAVIIKFGVDPDPDQPDVDSDDDRKPEPEPGPDDEGDEGNEP